MVSPFRASSSNWFSLSTSDRRQAIRPSLSVPSACRSRPSTRAFSALTRSRAGAKAFSTEKAGSRRPLGSSRFKLSSIDWISIPSRAGMRA